MIQTLALTLLIEGIVAAIYCARRGKSLSQVLLASGIVNLLTQTLLWVLLNLFPRQYLITLFVAEAFIWLIESAFLYFFPGTQLRWRSALLLSLGMNLASFGIGWFLPV